MTASRVGDCLQGREVFQELSRLPARGVRLQVAVNAPQSSTVDTAALAAAGRLS